ncbi:hypothetical protein [Deinococcus cellulosilyticus]|nr:hypothetical protein [Deinococcus cellulosilyticus]
MNLDCFVLNNGNCAMLSLQQQDMFELHITTAPLSPELIQGFT